MPSKLKQATKETLQMTSPMLASNMTNAIKRFIGMLMIAQIGPLVLAAGALITTIQTTVLLTTWAFIFAAGILVAHAFGAGDKKAVGQIWRESLVFGALISIPASFICWYMGPILLLFNQPPQIVRIVAPYFHVIAFAMLPGMWTISNFQLWMGISRPKIGFAFSLINLPINLLFAYFMVFGGLGIPKLGVMGLALATTIMWWLFFTTQIIYMARRELFREYDLFHFKSLRHLSYLGKLFTLGWPISIQFGGELIAWTVRIFMMGWLGATALGACQVAMQINTLMFMFVVSVSDASSILVGQSIGRKALDMTREYKHAALLIGAVVLGIVAIAFWTIPRWLIHFYLDIHNPANAQMEHIAIMMLALLAVTLFFDGQRNILTGVLRGMKDSQAPMWVGVVSIWIIGLPISYLCGFVLHWGAASIYIGSIIAFFVGWVILWFRSRQQMRRLLQVRA